MEALAKKRCSFARLLFFLSTPSAPGSAATTKGDTPVDEEHGFLLSLARRAEERERTRNKLSEVSVFFFGGGASSFVRSLFRFEKWTAEDATGFFLFISLSFTKTWFTKKSNTPAATLFIQSTLS
jgi:hypothetical protein